MQRIGKELLQTRDNMVLITNLRHVTLYSAVEDVNLLQTLLRMYRGNISSRVLLERMSYTHMPVQTFSITHIERVI